MIFPPNLWHALRSTAIIVLLALGFGIGFALITCSGCQDDAPLPTCPATASDGKACTCTRDGRCSCDGVPCQREAMSIERPDGGSQP